MRFDHAVDQYIADMKSATRINSPHTEALYRKILAFHAEDVGNRDPRTIGRNDVKQTLSRWANPNTQSTYRSILNSFYDWAMEEGLRDNNPSRMTRRPRKRKSTVYRLTRDEVAALLNATSDTREKRLIYIGVYAGLRAQELGGLQGRHFQRDGFVWVSPDIGKGGRERYVPVMPGLAAVVAEIRDHVADTEYVIPARRIINPPKNTEYRDDPSKGASYQSIYNMVVELGVRARIAAHIHPHLMRHAFGDDIARRYGVRIAQAMLGHQDLQTTAGYTGDVTLDELTAALAAVHGEGYGEATPLPTPPKTPVAIVDGNKDAESPNRPSKGFWPVQYSESVLAPMAPRIELYIKHFSEEAACLIPSR